MLQTLAGWDTPSEGQQHANPATVTPASEHWAVYKPYRESQAVPKKTRII